MILHGECIILKVEQLPENCKRVKTKGNYHIVAESEMSGNHHVIDVEDGVEFYEKDGVLYLKADKETRVRCVIKERHDSVKIDKGLYRIDFQKEFDYLSGKERVVAD